MLINFRQPILDFNNEPMLWPRERLEEGKLIRSADVLLVMNACQEGLGGGFEDERMTLSQTVKMERFMLGVRISSSKQPVEITTEEAGEILRLVSKAFPGSLVYPRVSEIFNAVSKAAEPTQEPKIGE